jgi:hypothetical protein
MKTELLAFEGKTVRVAGQTWTVEHPLADARIVQGVVIVIYDYMSGPRHRQFQNAEGFDFTGRKLWTAQHPTNETADAYVSIVGVNPLVLWNFACYSCTIDPANGRLLAAVFTK